MDQNFERSLARVLVYEGGYSNHPRDPGGETNRGIIKRVYDGWRRRHGLPLQSVRLISTDELKAIYREQYWDACRAGALPAGVDFVVFDGTVNSGAGQSVKWLQRSLAAAGLYHGAIDGDCGIATLSAVAQHPDHDKLIADILARRLGMLKSLKTWGDFGVGWSRRVSSALAIGQAWATGSVGPQPIAVAELGGAAKGYAGDVATATVSQGVATNAAAGGTGVYALLQSLPSTIQPYTDSSPIIAKVFVGLTLLSATAAVVGAGVAFWSAYQNRRAQAAVDGDIVATITPLGA